jgi:hypothetical protein
LGLSTNPATEEVKSYVAPAPATLVAFQIFAKSNSLIISSLSNTNKWIEFRTSDSQANKLFGASY